MTVDQSQPYTITGAPRIVKDKVIIGNGGAELGVRGYVSAYDPADGKLAVALLYGARRSREAASKRRISSEPRRHGPASGGSSAAAAPCGTRWPTIPSSTCCTSASATARPGTSNIAAPAAATICICSSIVAIKPETGEYVLALSNDAGRDVGLHRDSAHRPRRHRRSTVSRARCSCRRRRTASSMCLDRTNGQLISAEAVRTSELGDGDRHEDRPAGRRARRALSRSEGAVRCVSRVRTARTTGTRCRTARGRGSCTSPRTTCRTHTFTTRSSPRNRSASTSAPTPSPPCFRTIRKCARTRSRW